MRELRLENKLKEVQSKLENWARILENKGEKNLSEWMLQESNRIQIALESY